MARPKTITNYIARHRHTIAKTIESRAIMEEYMGTEKKQGSPSHQFWWVQEMSLKKDDKGKLEGAGVHPNILYNTAGNAVNTEQVLESPDARERYVTQPDADTNIKFDRGVNLDG